MVIPFAQHPVRMARIERTAPVVRGTRTRRRIRRPVDASSNTDAIRIDDESRRLPGAARRTWTHSLFDARMGARPLDHVHRILVHLPIVWCRSLFTTANRDGHLIAGYCICGGFRADTDSSTTA